MFFTICAEVQVSVCTTQEVCVCVCVCVFIRFVWLGLFMCTLIRYLIFIGEVGGGGG